jgi:hypothetical protein
MESLTNLTTFSYTIEQYQNFLEKRHVAMIINSLPQTCVNLEIDTVCEQDLSDGVAGDQRHTQICEALRRVLPRMRNVRLRLASMCESMLGTVDGENFTPIDMPNLETLIINCRLGAASLTWNCPREQSNADNPVLNTAEVAKSSWQPVTTVMQALTASGTQHVPASARLCIVFSMVQPYNNAVDW